MLLKKYAEPGGALYFADDLDDLYERIYNWGLFYAIGADERLLELALQCWNASTRITDDSIVHRTHPRFSQQGPQGVLQFSTTRRGGMASFGRR